MDVCVISKHCRIIVYTKVYNITTIGAITTLFDTNDTVINAKISTHDNRIELDPLIIKIYTFFLF